MVLFLKKLYRRYSKLKPFFPTFYQGGDVYHPWVIRGKKVLRMWFKMVNALELRMNVHEFEEWLNELYESVAVCGYIYYQGSLLRSIDPVTFRCIMADEPSKWQCDDCGEIYEDEDDANDCCKEEFSLSFIGEGMFINPGQDPGKKGIKDVV